MKKYYIMLSLLTFGSFATMAQTTTESSSETAPSCSLKSKNGHEVLPQANEWAIGASATPFFNYVGNLFRNGVNAGNNNEAPTFDNANHPDLLGAGTISPGNAIWVKKMVNAKTAYRGRVQFDFSSTRNRYNVAKDTGTADLTNQQFVTDKQTFKTANILLAAGLEKRRGSSRLQGVYGAEAIIGFQNTITKNEFGNDISNLSTLPASPIGGGAPIAGARVLRNDPGKTFYAAVRAFAGVEYFIAPKISLGGEFGYSLGIARSGKGSQTYEYWDGASQQVKEVTNKTSPGGFEGVGLGLDTFNANINLFFYF